jgi:hypothetical protein
MEKTAQQTSGQGTLVGEDIPAESGRHVMDNPVDLSPGTSETPQKDSEQMTHGQATYPGLRPDDANNVPGPNPPPAGNADTGDTNSASETGQDGDLTDVHKKKAYNYS